MIQRRVSSVLGYSRVKIWTSKGFKGLNEGKIEEKLTVCIEWCFLLGFGFLQIIEIIFRLQVDEDDDKDYERNARCASQTGDHDQIRIQKIKIRKRFINVSVFLTDRSFLDGRGYILNVMEFRIFLVCRILEILHFKTLNLFKRDNLRNVNSVNTVNQNN